MSAIEGGNSSAGRTESTRSGRRKGRDAETQTADPWGTAAGQAEAGQSEAGQEEARQAEAGWTETT